MQNHASHKIQLTEIMQTLSMYHALQLRQIFRLYPELPETIITTLLKRLKKAGRLKLLPDQNILTVSNDTQPNPETIAAFWVLLDFYPEITYHTASDFPVTLTFYTGPHCYDVICVPQGKEAIDEQCPFQMR